MRWILAAATPLALAACGQPQPEPGDAAESAAEASLGEVEVAQPWARDSAGGTANAAVFMIITSPAPDRLIAASSPMAQKTDLMTMKSEGGAMGMAYIDGIGLPAGQAVSLDPSGLHVWFEKLKQPLKAGDTFALTLEFEKAGKREVIVPVIAPAAPAPTARS